MIARLMCPPYLTQLKGYRVHLPILVEQFLLQFSGQKVDTSCLEVQLQKMKNSLKCSTGKIQELCRVLFP